jgi:hypothetical protein
LLNASHFQGGEAESGKDLIYYFPPFIRVGRIKEKVRWISPPFIRRGAPKGGGVVWISNPPNGLVRPAGNNRR